LLFIIANAMLFAHVLTTERIPHTIAHHIVEMGLEPWMFLVVVNLLLLAAGNFMEPSAILLIMAPILFPIAVRLGIDPIHLGIIMVVNMEIGMLTPPVGLNLFVTAGITGHSIGWVIKAALPWLLLLLIFLMLITYIPQISLFLPEYIDHLKGYN
jgi:C4-dicarboxylate transporter, DctM subunit